MFSKLIRYVKFYYLQRERERESVRACVRARACVFSLITLVHYVGKIIHILLIHLSYY